ncbi:nucleotidyltransferase family protein [Chitinophaga sp.]|uniref:nucleotidyltransferase family protein n=1 Tax=Chitinophaga sp. TaxID=1869181 RepID=UPI002F93E382
METTGIIILAAGASKRLGTPKQQLPFQNKSLLQNVVHTARQSGSMPIVVVLGAFATQIKQQLATEKVNTVVNPAWPSGMGGSITTGLQHLLHLSPHVNSALLLLCDQPFITTSLLEEMYALKSSSGKAIVACSYGNTIGTPALFDKSIFPQLLSLTGQEGAKKILLQHPEQVATVDFPQGAVDIDTNGDYEQLLAKV